MVSNACSLAFALSALARGALGHGWVTQPVSKNELAFRLKEDFPQGGSFRYEPQSSANGNLYGQTSSAPGSSCGAPAAVYEEGPTTWQQWYDASRGLAMPSLIPGSQLEVQAKITADHGGQAWMMIACDDRITEQADWVLLQRSPADQGHNFMPSNPSIYAWAVGESKNTGGILKAVFDVPDGFSCANGLAIGRWLWKTANSCIDANNVGRKTETFNLGEFKTIAPSGLPVCTIPPEIFISCFDFKVSPVGATPPPTLVSTTPSPSPGSIASPTALPTSAPIPTQPSEVEECVPQTVLQCINDKSSFWPRCDPSQAKDVEGPSGYEFGYYCTQEWARALNEMLSDPVVGKCHDRVAVHKLLAQVAYETGYFSTVFQPQDGGAGLIHMIPGNWPVNAADMDALFPGNDFASAASTMGKNFFQSAAYGWKSVAAWFKLTNRVIASCGLDLFDQPFEEQTRCILSRVVSRQEAFDIVGSCMSALPAPEPEPTVAPTKAPTVPPDSVAPTPSTTSSHSSTTETTLTTTANPAPLECKADGSALSWGATDARCQEICGLVQPNTWPCGDGFPCSCSLVSSTTRSVTAAPVSTTTQASTPLPTQAPAVAPPSATCGSCSGCLWSNGLCYMGTTKHYCQSWTDNLWCGRALAIEDHPALRGQL